MSRPARARRLRVAAVPLLAAPLLAVLAGCGAGLSAQTYQERTASDAANTAVGPIAVRNLRVQPPLVGSIFERGANATVELTLVSRDDEPDTLIEVASPAAGEVVQTVDGEQSQIVVPALGSTVNTARLQLVGLDEQLRSGQNVMLSMRFQRAGSVEISVPIGLTGSTDRPVLTGGEEGEPALQGPAGGHGEDGGEQNAE